MYIIQVVLINFTASQGCVQNCDDYSCYQIADLHVVIIWLQPPEFLSFSLHIPSGV